MVKTATIKLLNKKVKIVLPSFSSGITTCRDKDDVYAGVYVETTYDGLLGFMREFTYDIKDDYRHISITELAELMHCNNRQKKEIFAELFLAYLLEKGVDLKKHDWKIGICLSDGVRREGEDLIVFKNIDRKIECITEVNNHTIVGYKIKNGLRFEGERFSLKRVFRRYGGQKVTLKQINKSNPDLVKALFSQEYDNLSEVIQKSRFILPPDTFRKVSKKYGSGKCNIWPLCLDVSSELLSKQLGDSTNIDIGGFVLKEITIFPYKISCGFLHFPVKDIL